MRRFVRENYPINRLPQDLHPHLPEGRLVRVVIEDDISDEDLLAELDREIEKGTADLEAGRVHPVEDVRAKIQARFNDARRPERSASLGREEATRPDQPGREGHFSRFYCLRREHFASVDAIRHHVEALRDEWQRR